MKLSLIALILGFALDMIFGDPHWMPHPVRLIGKLIFILEKGLRKLFLKTPKGEFMAGVVLWVAVTAASTAIPVAILVLCSRIHPLLRLAVETVMCYQILATKALKSESMKVYEELKKGSLEGARKMVSMIVGRDTQNLSELQVAKAAVETVAENTSDGVVAPLIYLAVGGAPFGFFYKAVNTMDSMIGYENDRYLHFGKFAAKLDDAANYVPARISGWLMIFAAYLLHLDGRHAAEIYKRDRNKHASPNSAHTEAVCAGALNIQLAGDAYYFGKLHKKQTLGDNIRPVCYEDIIQANRLLYVTAVLALAGCAIIKAVAIWLL
nr:adenosylcobinamide-phosphate synthase CbiB [uncultured Caproiciproducens sp.]